MKRNELLTTIIDSVKFDVCKYWSNWGKKEKQEWILSLLVSGSDYGASIERNRLGVSPLCFYDEHKRCNGKNEHDTICKCEICNHD